MSPDSLAEVHCQRMSRYAAVRRVYVGRGSRRPRSRACGEPTSASRASRTPGGSAVAPPPRGRSSSRGGSPDRSPCARRPPCHVSRFPPVRRPGPIERRLVPLQGVRRREEVAAGTDLRDRLHGELASDTSIGWSTSAIIWRISASTMSFSYDAVRPPSSQPAPVLIRLTPPITAPHTAISLRRRPGCRRRSRQSRWTIATAADNDARAAGRERPLDRLGRPERRRAGAHVDVRGERRRTPPGAGPDELRQAMQNSASAFCCASARRRASPGSSRRRG